MAGDITWSERDRHRKAAPREGDATLLLIRHGHTQDNTAGMEACLRGWTNVPLSDLGRHQAHLLGARLKDMQDRHLVADGARLCALYTSPLHRARETADLLADAIGLQPRVRRALCEINCGALDGVPVRVVEREHPALWRRNLAQDDDTFRWPGGESYGEFRARCVACIRRIAEAHPGQQVAVVTHTGVITQVVGALRGIPPARWDSFRAGNASITVVRWLGDASTGSTGSTGGTVDVFDDRLHLQADAGALVAQPRLASPHGVGPTQHT